MKKNNPSNKDEKTSPKSAKQKVEALINEVALMKKNMPHKFSANFLWGMGAGLLVALIVTLQFIGNLRLQHTVETIAENNAQIIDELGQMRQFVSSFGDDLNEAREFLLLPTNSYDTSLFSEESNEEESGEETVEDPVVTVFQYLEKLGSTETTEAIHEENATHLDAYINAEENVAWFGRLGLTLRNGIDHRLTDTTGTTMVFVQLKENGAFHIETFGNVVEIEDSTDFEVFKVSMDDLLNNQLSAIVEFLDSINASHQFISTVLRENEALQETLISRALTIAEDQESDTAYLYEILKEDGETLTSIKINKESGEIWMEDTNLTVSLENEAVFVAAVKQVLELYDPRSDMEIQIDLLYEAIESLDGDEGFQSILTKYGFTFSFEETETTTEIIYEISDSEGAIIQYLYISKETGELMSRDPESETGNLVSSMLITEKKTMELPSSVTVHEGLIDSDDEINILVAGKHGSNVDTIILANINTVNQEIHLISVPRDLYYNSRKINSVYYFYGMEEMTRQVSDVVGRKIDQHILVDMYVFADLVDLFGGVDVTLNEDLIDPTYKTYENGLASTLYYPAGTHHVDGVESLRIARSRHTTSDYSRADRQQLILKGLQDQAKTIGFGDAATVLDLLTTVIDNTETDISIDDAFNYYLRYRNFDLNTGNVLTTANVLASVKVPVGYETSLKINHCDDSGVCAETYAIYTLSPREDNWDYVRWYVDEILSS
jgi:polyisoprenyl-teichoic acid--peptidoglycan teichoic acid transferase